jgi:hypothetical protein
MSRRIAILSWLVFVVVLVGVYRNFTRAADGYCCCNNCIPCGDIFQCCCGNWWHGGQQVRACIDTKKNKNGCIQSGPTSQCFLEQDMCFYQLLATVYINPLPTSNTCTGQPLPREEVSCWGNECFFPNCQSSPI